MSDQHGQPWGHKITVSIYVEGALSTADEVWTHTEVPGLPQVVFVGAAISEVQDEPHDQRAT